MNTLIFGSVASGKSLLAGLLTIQAMRRKGILVRIVDKEVSNDNGREDMGRS